MKSSWRSLLLMLFLAEVLLLALFIHGQPQCEPCLPGAPCPPCITDEQRMIVLVGGLLPFGVVAAQLILQYRARRRRRP